VQKNVPEQVMPRYAGASWPYTLHDDRLFSNHSCEALYAPSVMGEELAQTFGGNVRELKQYHPQFGLAQKFSLTLKTQNCMNSELIIYRDRVGYFIRLALYAISGFVFIGQMDTQQVPNLFYVLFVISGTSKN
jgi:hypothetical protein